MSESRGAGDRTMFATTIILAGISVTMYFIVYLTLFRYQMLNDAGRTFSLLALVFSAGAMLLACYLTLTNRGRLLSSTGLSGLGWILICGGLMIGAPAVGADAAFPGNGSGGVSAALFLIIAGAAVLQAERNTLPDGQATPDDHSRLN
ncbi:hypothetical protein TFLX_02011 [Thermoflexales bacterium]|nr:hypothetical protein TFLX_02011 [Thermoflexales bacterium]